MAFRTWRTVKSVRVVPALAHRWEITVQLWRTTGACVYCAFLWVWSTFRSYWPLLSICDWPCNLNLDNLTPNSLDGWIEVLYSWLEVLMTYVSFATVSHQLLWRLDPACVICARYCLRFVYAPLWSPPITYAREWAVNPPLGMGLCFHFSDLLATWLFVIPRKVASAVLDWPCPCAHQDATTEILDIFVKQLRNNLLVGKYPVPSTVVGI